MNIENEEHYFTRDPKSKLKTTEVSFSFHNHQLSFLCVSGVFSAKEIDKATQLLLERAEIQPDANVLDLGCGIGVIGISIKKAFPTAHVTLSDVNKRALKISRENAERNKVIVEVRESDCYDAFAGKEETKGTKEETKGTKEEEKVKQFDLIITNPPHHAGRELVYKMIIEAPAHLRENGILQLVAKHNKGGKMLQKKMEDVFGNVAIVSRQSGFCVYKSKNI